MNNRYQRALAALLVTGLVAYAASSPARGQEALGRTASWASPTYPETRAAVVTWLEAAMPADGVKTEVLALWPEEGVDEREVELLDRLARTYSLVLPAAKELVDFCQQPAERVSLPTFAVLGDEAVPAEVRGNLKLYYARWLVHNELYDEALTVVANVMPADVAAPATLLFHQSVSHHRLLQKDECLPKIAKLLENEDAIPRRYREVTRLMEADLRPLKPDTLDEVSRIMDNVRRRLDLGRAGKRVRQEEDDVVAKLDKMIEELEQQQQQQQQQQQGGGGNANRPPGQPQDDSMPAGGSGPGNVAQKNIGRGSGWGNLPHKDREEAMQEITKNLPAHYREVIEEYFRKLARTSE